MKSTTHSLRSHSLCNYHRFLRPGALARLRDSRINAKSHADFIIPLCVPDSSSTQSVSQQIALTVADDFPFYSGRLFGPRCLKRKKFVANKNVVFVSTRNDSESVETVVN